MRRYCKNKVIDILQTIDEANQELGRMLSCGQEDGVLGLLEGQQHTMICLGEYIETNEDSSQEVIALFEEYCELLWEYAEAVDETPRRKLLKHLERRFRAIWNYVRWTLPEQYEIVFLPYKASMWDSMESVWDAANNSKVCHCTVVPIPYYDKTDGRMTEFHYEGGEYPPYVPVTDYREYSLGEMHPEVIVFHNPYDQYNLVTSVEPDYYSEILKDQTDLLVYIPYFVYANNVEPYACRTPGEYYAQMVVLQSERVRDIYLRIAMENASFPEVKDQKFLSFLHASKKKELEQKFLALGSPKIDKVRFSKIEDYKYPDEWANFIDSGSGKTKIILYNNTIEDLLKYGDRMLDKIEWTLSVFNRNRNVKLLWRPHPLLHSTMMAMRPGLLDRYENIVAGYRRASFGIFDDTSDLHRSLAVSDGYYGDKNSLVPLFQAVGKPVMIQDPCQRGDSVSGRPVVWEPFDRGEIVESETATLVDFINFVAGNDLTAKDSSGLCETSGAKILSEILRKLAED